MRPSLPSRADRRGIALPLSIFFLTGLSLILAVGILRNSAERRSSADHSAQVDALAVAQSGIELFRSTLTTPPSTFPYSTTVTLTNGTADVTMYRIHDAGPGGRAMYLLASRGHSTAGRKYDARTPDAERTVAQYFEWAQSTFPGLAALTAITGVTNADTLGAYDGNDACTSASRPPIPGVASSNGRYNGSTIPIRGSTGSSPLFIGSNGVSGTAKNAVVLDWASIVSGASMAPNFAINNTVSPATGVFPTTSDFDSWPVLFVRGDFTLPADGKGVLVVTGKLVLSGSVQWKGLVLTGGPIVASNGPTVEGGAITGLNVKLGIFTPRDTMLTGGKTFRYHSCYIDSALVRYRGLVPLASTWSDNWPSY